jgi:hypothetical protein
VVVFAVKRRDNPSLSKSVESSCCRVVVWVCWKRAPRNISLSPSTPRLFQNSCLDHDNRPLPTCHRIIRCSIISSRDILWSWSPPKLPFALFYPVICVVFSFVNLPSHPAISISPLDCAGSYRPSSQIIFHDVCDIHGQG